MKILVLALLLCAAFACREVTRAIPADIEFVAPPVVRYTKADIQKIHWIKGAWKSTQPEQAIQQNFQFHPDNTLEITEIGHTGGTLSSLLMWHEGCYYLGDNREWVVTWIGEKDVRFEPTRPGRDAFTWTRFGEDQWYHVSHQPRGDQPVLMHRIGGLQP